MPQANHPNTFSRHRVAPPATTTPTAGHQRPWITMIQQWQVQLASPAMMVPMPISIRSMASFRFRASMSTAAIFALIATPLQPGSLWRSLTTRKPSARASHAMMEPPQLANLQSRAHMWCLQMIAPCATRLRHGSLPHSTTLIRLWRPQLA